jgi:uncharacterized membrane protein
MRKFILSSLELFSHIAIFLILLSGLIQGAIGGGVVGDVGGAIVGGAIGFLFALVGCVVIFGVIFLLMEIADNSRRTVAALEAMRSDQAD